MGNVTKVPLRVWLSRGCRGHRHSRTSTGYGAGTERDVAEEAEAATAILRDHDQRKNSSTPPVAAIPPLYVGALVSGDTLSRALDVFLSLIQLSVEST